MTTYGSTSRVEVGWSADTVCTATALSEGGAVTVAIGLQVAGGSRTQRVRSPAVTADAPSNSGSVVDSEAMVATTCCT